MSEEAQRLYEKFYGKKSHSATKLSTTLLSKQNYVLHIFNLDLYTELGMRVTKVHRALSFYQAPFLDPWVDLCTSKRRECQLRGDAFGRNFWKLMVNSVFGKFIENQRSRRSISFLSKDEEILKAFNSPRLIKAEFMNDDMCYVLNFIEM